MSFRRPRFRRTGAAVLAVVLPLALATVPSGSASFGASAASQLTYPRGVNIVRPIDDDRVSRVIRWSGQPARGATYRAGCTTPIVAAHPGTAGVASRPEWGNRKIIVVRTTAGGLVSVHRWVHRSPIRKGQLIQAGQYLGQVTKTPGTNRCEMNLQIRKDGVRLDTERFLAYREGRPVPVRDMLTGDGFEVASFNILGANHTDTGGSKASWPNYDKRMPRTIQLLNDYSVDVAGLQEIQWRQRTLFQKMTGTTWGIYPPHTQNDNSIIWRRSQFSFVRGGMFQVPYFNGDPKDMPWIELRERSTGRTAYFVNVHNPATNRRRGNHDAERAEAIRIERQKVIDLRANGRPVFLTGDFNDRAAAFCPLTRDKLMISPDSVPSMDCAMPPKYWWVDWIFAAGQSRFTRLTVDTSPRDTKTSDHPLVVGRAHFQN